MQLSEEDAFLYFQKIFYNFGAGILLLILNMYYYLGGFTEIEILFHNEDQFIISGNYFRGKYDSDTGQNLFYKVKSYIDTGQLDGKLAIVNFNQHENKSSQ